jgi:dolichol-phosphate mannosyltransferase
MKTLVIMPTYNEALSLAETVRNLFANAPEVSLLIVDDASPDGTGTLADSLAEVDQRVSVLHRSAKGGLGAAYIAGFGIAKQRGFDFVVEMDADGSHRGVDLPKLLAVAPEFDLVIGSRYVRGGGSHGWSLHRKLISRLGNAYTSFILGAKIRDITAGFRVYRLDFLMPILDATAAHGYAFQVELAWKARLAGGRIIEVPILFEERAHGSSKMSSAIVREALWLTTKWGLGRVFKPRP